MTWKNLRTVYKENVAVKEKLNNTSSGESPSGQAAVKRKKATMAFLSFNDFLEVSHINGPLNINFD